MDSFYKKITSAFVVLGVALVGAAPFAQAYVASSSNYIIQSDSINNAGGLSTSTSYRTQDTVGESGVGTSSSPTYQLKGGYQQMQETYIAISAPGNVTMLPNIPSVGGGVADGVAVWTVTTDDPAGYTMNIVSALAPALKSGANSFADYAPAGANPDFTFTTAATSANFGFSPEGSDIVQKYKDNGASCNAGALDSGSACWSGLSTTANTIVTRTTPNHPSGTATTVRFRAASGASNTQPAGSYTATATLTVIAL